MVTDARLPVGRGKFRHLNSAPVSCSLSWEIRIQFVALCVCVCVMADFGVLLNVSTVFHFPDIEIFEHIYSSHFVFN